MQYFLGHPNIYETREGGTLETWVGSVLKDIVKNFYTATTFNGNVSLSCVFKYKTIKIPASWALSTKVAKCARIRWNGKPENCSNRNGLIASESD